MNINVNSISLANTNHRPRKTFIHSQHRLCTAQPGEVALRQLQADQIKKWRKLVSPDQSKATKNIGLKWDEILLNYYYLHETHGNGLCCQQRNGASSHSKPQTRQHGGTDPCSSTSFSSYPCPWPSIYSQSNNLENTHEG